MDIGVLFFPRVCQAPFRPPGAAHTSLRYSFVFLYLPYLHRLTVPYSLPIVPSRDPTPLCRERPPSFAGDRLRLMARGNFGERLKRERELREVSVDELTKATRISARFIGALENEDWDK